MLRIGEIYTKGTNVPIDYVGRRQAIRFSAGTVWGRLRKRFYKQYRTGYTIYVPEEELGKTGNIDNREDVYKRYLRKKVTLGGRVRQYENGTARIRESPGGSEGFTLT